ncbi:MTR protein, partial [Geococcyx californianus]|nr:MTR protein [Geococcyx californianus]
QIHIFSLRDVGNGVYDCWADFIQPWGPKAYVTWITLMVYIIPVLMLSICYGLISFKIWQNVKLKTAHGPNVGLSSNSCSGMTFARVSSTKLISKAKIRTVKMTFIIVLAFIVCWTPFFFVQMWSVWDTNAPQEASPFIIAMLLASLNSCCNPWIYMLYTGHLFRDLVRRFLCCSTRYLKSQPACELSVSKKSNSSSFVLSCKSTSQRSFMHPSMT